LLTNSVIYASRYTLILLERTFSSSTQHWNWESRD